MDWPAVDVHGFVSQGYLNTTGNTFIEQSEDGTFAYNEIGINIGSQVTDQLRIGAQIFAYELGDYGNNTLIVDWAYADYRHSDALGLRLGRYKLPLGMYGEMLDLDLAFTAVLMPQAVYDARYRELYGGLNGAQMYGILPLGAGGNLEYQAFVGTMNIENDGYLADQFTQGPNALSNVESIEIGTTYGATLNWRPPLPGLRLHFSSLISNDLDVSGNVSVAVPNPPLTFTFDLPTTSHVKNFSIISFGSEYSADRLTLAAEYRVQQGSLDIEINSTSVGGGIVRANQDIHSDGGYLLAAYRLNDAWEIGSYYGIYFSDRNDRDGDRYAGTGTDRARAWQRDLALTVRWDVNPSWIVKLEGH